MNNVKNKGELSEHFPDMVKIIATVNSVDDALDSAWQINLLLDKKAHRINQYILQDILSHSGKSEEVQSVIMTLRSEHIARTDAKISSMLKPKSAFKIDYEQLRLKGSLALTAKMGEGKNAICMEPWFDQAVADRKYPIFIAPLKALLEKFVCHPEHYQTLVDAANPRQGLRTTAHSFISNANADMRSRSGVVFIDEFVRTVEMINSNIFGNADMQSRLIGWTEIVNAIKLAEHAVLADAHLGQAYLNIIERLTGKRFPAYETQAASYSNISVEYGYAQSSLLEKTRKLVGEGKKVAYFFDGNIDDGKAIEATLNGIGIKAIYFYSNEKNNVGSAVCEATKNPEALAGYDVVICSPAIGPGWSCVLDGYRNVMIECVGTISPASVLQCIKRFRAVQNVSIAFNINSKRVLPETAKNVAFNQASQEIQVAFDHDSIMSTCNDYLNNPVGMAICEMTALENWSRNHYELFVVRGLDALGFKASRTDAENSKKMSSLKRKQSEQIAKDKRSFFLNNEFLKSNEQHDLSEMKIGQGISQSAQWLLEKDEAAKLMLKLGKFSEQEVDFILQKNGCKLIRRLNLTKLSGKTSLANKTKSDLLRELFKFSTVETLDSEETEAFYTRMKSEKLRWNGKEITKFTLLTKTLFDVKGCSKPSTAVKNMLALVGIKMSSCPSKAAGRYVLDKSVFDFAMRYVSPAAAETEAA